MATHGTPLPDDVLESIRRNKVAIKGPITTPVGKGFRSVNVTLRQALDLYANLRPVRSMKGVQTRYEDVDLVIVRENTEDLYAGIEHEVIPGRRGEHQDHHARGLAADRALRVRLRRRNGRRKVTAVHKANIMKLLRRPLPRQLPRGRRRSTRTSSSRIASSTTCACSSSRSPSCTTCWCCPNLYGDIVCDLARGPRRRARRRPGREHRPEAAVFEAVHGTAPKYAGQNKANPTALILSGVLMLRHLGHPDVAGRLEDALRVVVAEGRSVTYDLGGTAGTSQFADAIIEQLATPAPTGAAATT